MSNIMSIVAATMRADAEEMRLVGQNVSSADSVAYRRQFQVAHTSFAEAESVTAGAAPPRTPQAQVGIDARPGTLKSTGEPLDAAIQGDAYFVVETSRGEMLMRRGDFHLDTDGVLSAFSGDPVSGTEGSIRIPSGSAPKIDPDGTVRAGTDVIGHLRLVQLPPGATLEPASDGLFTSGGAAATPSPTAQVHQGFLETSNVSPVNEMVRLLQTMRHFEASQRFARAYDEMLDRAITDLGKV